MSSFQYFVGGMCRRRCSLSNSIATSVWSRRQLLLEKPPQTRFKGHHLPRTTQFQPTSLSLSTRRTVPMPSLRARVTMLVKLRCPSRFLLHFGSTSSNSWHSVGKLKHVIRHVDALFLSEFQNSLCTAVTHEFLT